jgi:beta-glucosidase
MNKSRKKEIWFKHTGAGELLKGNISGPGFEFCFHFNRFRMIKYLLLLLTLSLLISGSTAFAQTLPYQNPGLSTSERVEDLLKRMTLREKFWQVFMIPGDLDEGKDRYTDGIFGFQTFAAGLSGDAAGQMLTYKASGSPAQTAAKINALQKFFREETRLGIPIIPFDEALHGLVRDGAITFPQSIALAATWDTALVHRVAGAIAAECRSRGIRQILSPVVNLATDVRWGRTEETYGEDPLLASRMGVAYVSAFEEKGVITTPKHFVSNSGAGGRDSYPVDLSERYLNEFDFQPFQACFSLGKSRSVMTSYNSWNGAPCTANDRLLNQILKKDWGFDGFVISDACAVGGANVLHYTASGYADAAAQAINNGLDVIFQTSYDHYPLFWPAFEKGLVKPEALDEAVRRVLRAKFELGLFENPYTDPAEADRLNGSDASRQLALQAARESVVLLKNDNQVLPISDTVKSILVIGPDAVECRLGGYSGPGIRKTSVLDGLREMLPSGCKLTYVAGPGRSCDTLVMLPAEYLSCIRDGKTESGLYGEYFPNTSLSGSPVMTRTDQNMRFAWTLYPPDPLLEADCYSVRWTGTLQVPETGWYRLGMEGTDGYRMYIGGEKVIDQWTIASFGAHTVNRWFEKGKAYPVRIEFFESSGPARIELVWNYGAGQDWKQKIAEAVEATRSTSMVIIVAGIEEGEFRDRALLGLPGKQEDLIRSVAASGKPVVVLISGGSAVTMSSWISQVQAVADLWYPGEEGGRAVAEILTGRQNPSGRLPITFPLSEGQLPLVYNHKPTGRGDDYDNQSGQPLFPFGYGLSYTTFEYSDLKFSSISFAAGQETQVSCTVKNTGSRSGDEVVQLYIRDRLASLAQPVTALKGFERVHLEPGEAKQVSFRIRPDMLKLLNRDMKWVVEPGEFRIMIGASCRDIRLRDTITVL